MKKLIIICSLFLLIACESSTTTGKQRVHVTEYTIDKGYGFMIVEVDGVEYIAMSQGGICPLKK